MKQSILDRPTPDWESMTASGQARHYAEALAEARARVAQRPSSARSIESKLRRHTPPSIRLRHDGDYSGSSSSKTTSRRR